MGALSSKRVADLVALAERLLKAAKLLQGETPQVDADVAADVAEKMKKRICLACDSVCPEGQSYRRGLDVAHYNHALRLIEAGDVTEEELMASGKLGPKRKTGRQRKPSSLDGLGKSREQAQANIDKSPMVRRKKADK